MHYNKLKMKLVSSEIFKDCEGLSHQLRCLNQLHKKDMRNLKKNILFFLPVLKKYTKNLTCRGTIFCDVGINLHTK